MTLVATLALGVHAGPAASADTSSDPLSGRGSLGVGVFSNRTDLQIRFDPSSLKLGTEVDWDQRFGLADSHRFRVDGLWRFKPRHHLRVLYTDYSQTDRARIDKEIQWGDELIPVNSDVTGRLGFKIVELAYEYTFLKRPNHELAASLGVHYTALSAQLFATLNSASVGSRSVGGRGARRCAAAGGGSAGPVAGGQKRLSRRTSAVFLADRQRYRRQSQQPSRGAHLATGRTLGRRCRLRCVRSRDTTEGRRFPWHGRLGLPWTSAFVNYTF